MGREAGWWEGSGGIVDVGVRGTYRSKSFRLQTSTCLLSGDVFEGVGGVRGKAGCFCSVGGCCSVVIVGCIDSSGKSLSRFSIFLQICWRSAAKSTGVRAGVASGRSFVGTLVESVSGACGVGAVAD